MYGIEIQVDPSYRGMRLSRRLYEVRKEICRERNLACLDAASRLPREGRVFWDDAHFTEEGARLLAELVTDFLLSREPLASLARVRLEPE